MTTTQLPAGLQTTSAGVEDAHGDDPRTNYIPHATQPGLRRHSQRCTPKAAARRPAEGSTWGNASKSIDEQGHSRLARRDPGGGSSLGTRTRKLHPACWICPVRRGAWCESGELRVVLVVGHCKVSGQPRNEVIVWPVGDVGGALLVFALQLGDGVIDLKDR